MPKKEKSIKSTKKDSETSEESLTGIHFTEDDILQVPAAEPAVTVQPSKCEQLSIVPSNSNQIEITVENTYPEHLESYPVFTPTFRPLDYVASADTDGSIFELEDDKNAELRNRNRLYGTRKCWARYCWADKHNTLCHSHPLETLSNNRLKLMAKGESDRLVVRSGAAYTAIRTVRYQGERVVRVLDFYGPIYRRIEGYYGSGIAGYVALINRLLVLSLYTFILLGGLFVVPTIVNFYRFQAGVARHVSNSNTSTVPEAVEREIFDIYAKSQNPAFDNLKNSSAAYYYLWNNRKIRQQPSEDSKTDAARFATSALELLEGTGWMESSWMFLGQYADRIDFVAKSAYHAVDDLIDGPFPYNIPLAFLCAIFGVLFVSAIVLIFGSGSSLKENLKGRHSRSYPFCEVLFSTWPHNLQFEGGVENQRLTETNQLKILLTGVGKQARRRRVGKEKALLYLIRGLVWVLVAGLLAAFGYLLFTSITDWVPANAPTPPAGTTVQRTTYEEFRHLFFSFLPSIIITVFNFLVPFILSFLVRFEEYSTSKIELRVTLVRTVFLRLASVVFLLFGVFLRLERTDSLPSPSAPNNKTFGFVVGNPNNTPCFETFVGQQIYKVLILDILVSILVFVGLDIPRKFLYKATKWELLRMEFDLSGNILSAIYVQCLYWLGVFYAPLLSGMAILHFLIRAILGQLGIFYVFAPPTKIHHSSGTDVFFTTVAMLSFFLVFLALGFAIIKIQPSLGCGPFLFMTDYATMYDYFMGTLAYHTGNFRFLIVIATSSVILFPLAIFMSVILYYKIATARAKEAGIKMLKQKITDATGLKKFLEARKRLKQH